MKQSDPPIIVEQVYEHPPEIVWEAITSHDQMLNWFFENIPSFEAKAGFKTSFPVKSETRTFTHFWKIISAEAPKMIMYDWSYKEYPGRGEVEFELFPHPSGTKLRLTNRVLEDFPSEIPEFKRSSCIGGWQYFLQDRLKNYLEIA